MHVTAAHRDTCSSFMSYWLNNANLTFFTQVYKEGWVIRFGNLAKLRGIPRMDHQYRIVQSSFEKIFQLEILTKSNTSW